MKIKTVRFSYLRNEAHLEFLLLFIKLLNKFPNTKGLVGALLAQFMGLLEKEQKLVDATKKSALTKKLKETDKLIDRLISGLKAAVRSALYRSEQEIKDAAQILSNRIKDFGNMRGKNYEEESIIVNGKGAFKGKKMISFCIVKN